MKSIHSLLLTVSASALLSINSAFGGTLTVTSGANPSQSLSGVTGNGSVASFSLSSFQYGSSTAVKIFGSETFTATAASGSISLAISGLVTFSATDKAFLPYDFTIAVSGTGTVTPSATISLGGGIVQSSNSLAAAPGGGVSTHYTGVTSPAGPAGVGAPNVPFSGSFMLSWSGATIGDTLTLTIPTNSVDFVVNPTVVPEPTSIALLGAAGLLGIFRRRR